MTSHQQEQKERRSLAGSTNETTTYRDIAARDLSLEGGGRYSQPTTIVGSTPTIRYPQASGPWTGGDPAGVEPPIGIDVSFVEPWAPPKKSPPASRPYHLSWVAVMRPRSRHRTSP